MRTKLPLAIGGLLTLVLVLTLLPLLVLATSPSSGSCGGSLGSGASVDAIASTIRHLESGGDYTARAPGSSASGAYQFLDSSWAGYGGYPRAYLAPPEVQDAKAIEQINAILAANGNDPAAVPVAWYLGHVPPPGSPEWDTVPAPGAGNRLTPREYQSKWMDIYRQQLAGGSAPTSTGGAGTAPATAPTACGPGGGAAGPYVLPVDRSWYDQHPDWFTQPHHDGRPAVDIPVPVGTPVYAATAGVVVSTPTSGDCGIGAVINGDDGAQYTYCHGFPGSHAIAVGDHVAPGQLLMHSASTGRSTGPHLHFQIYAAGAARCPQPFLVAIAQGQTIEPGQLMTSACAA